MWLQELSQFPQKAVHGLAIAFGVAGLAVLQKRFEGYVESMRYVAFDGFARRSRLPASVGRPTGTCALHPLPFFTKI
jgi:hypothetical protein